MNAPVCPRCRQAIVPGRLAPLCLGGRYRCDPSVAVWPAPPAPAPAPPAPAGLTTSLLDAPTIRFPQVAPGAAPSAPRPHLAAPPDLDRLGRDALRDLCRAAGVSTKGSPDDLRARLRTSAPKAATR